MEFPYACSYVETGVILKTLLNRENIFCYDFLNEL